MSLMGNKGKQGQSTHIQMNDYEKRRLLRVEENKERLRHLGVKSIANSLTSLVECQNTKRKKVKPTNNNVRHVDYTPMGDDCEGDSEEIDMSVEVSKKHHRPQFIAPLSMNKVVNLAKKHRLVAPKVCEKFPMISSATKENQSRGAVTMGQLILNNKGTQRQTEAFKQNEAEGTCITRGAKRQLALVDEDDDNAVDDEISQDINGTNSEQDGLKDVDNGGDDVMRSKGQDDEYGDTDDDSDASLEDEIQGDESDDSLENEDDVLFQEPLQGLQLEKSSAISISKKRGPTMMHDVHTRKVHESEAIICNEFGQPVGPEEKDIVGKFSRFLGTIARNHSYAPLIHKSWHKVPNKDKIWEYVLEKYDVPDAARTWVLKTIGHSYKVHKCRFKKKHFLRYKDDKTRWKNRPKNIPEEDFMQLLRLWNNKIVARRCFRAKEIRMSQKNMHTAGPKSFARIRDKMKNEDPNRESPTLTQMFERTRKRTEGRAYVDTYDDTATKIEQMKNYKPLENESAFMIVMNKEHHGYRRLYGRGVTNKLIKKVDGSDASYIIPGGLIESLKASVEVEKGQLLEIQKGIEEGHERKKAELEAMQKDIDTQKENLMAMQKDIYNQQQILETKMRKFMEQFGS